ncbi:MAG: phosphomannomutase/phosphoglucomutase [Xanthomonadales bacterium]|nr:phosphomannomutase/phosphoglucomutase [Xanthomonadales bacterium]
MTYASGRGNRKSGILGLGRNALLGVVALLLLLVAALFGYLGASGWAEQSGALNMQEERDRLAYQLGKRANEIREQYEGVLSYSGLRETALSGAHEAAIERIGSLWPALAVVEIYPADLSDVYIEGGDKVGFGKLAALSDARVNRGVSLQLVGKGSQLSLALSRMMVDPDAEGESVPEDEYVAPDDGVIIYAELPLSAFVDPVAAVNPGKGYIELRAGTTRLVTRGETELQRLAVASAVPGSPFQIAAANQADSGFLTNLLIAAVLGGTGIGLLIWLRRQAGPLLEDSSEPTLAELAARGDTRVDAPAGPKPKREEAARPKIALDRSIFRAYDIRGVVGRTLDATVARLIGQAIGSVIRDQGLREVVVGRDGRTSGPELVAALIEGLRSTGCDVIDIGLAPTPVVYFASHHLQAGSCIAVTGSHNPPDYNGFKVVVGGDTLSGDAITDLYERIAEDRLVGGETGGLQTMDVSRDYIDRIASDVQLERRLRVVVDCGNGVAGGVAPQVLEAIGCEAEELYCDVDGSFPNHHPDPSEPENLSDLITSVKRTGADLGLAFDGDGDRLGVVTAQGRIIYPDRVLMLFAQDVLSRNPGAAIIYDVKCTGHLAGQILRHGGSPVMWKTGHSLIKAKMKETEAELAGEMSGHFFFHERWYGFDDGIYAAARLLEILAMDDRDAESIFAELPDSVSTPEIKVPMEEGEHYAFIEAFREKARFEGAKIFTIDGVRADWPDGWGLVRCSNTTPCLVLRFDAESDAALQRIQASFREQILAVRSDLDLPF